MKLFLIFATVFTSVAVFLVCELVDNTFNANGWITFLGFILSVFIPLFLIIKINKNFQDSTYYIWDEPLNKENYNFLNPYNLRKRDFFNFVKKCDYFNIEGNDEKIYRISKLDYYLEIARANKFDIDNNVSREEVKNMINIQSENIKKCNKNEKEYFLETIKNIEDGIFQKDQIDKLSAIYNGSMYLDKNKLIQSNFGLIEKFPYIKKFMPFCKEKEVYDEEYGEWNELSNLMRRILLNGYIKAENFDSFFDGIRGFDEPKLPKAI